MSNGKEIRIKWVSDDSSIDQSIQNLQRKLQQINRTSGNIQNIQETGGQLSSRAQYAQKAFQKTSTELLQKESRELEQRQRSEMQMLLQKQRELNKLNKSEENITEEKRKQLEILKQEVNLQAQKVMDIETSKKKIDQTMRDMQPGGPGGPGGGDGPPTAGGGAPRNKESMMKDFARILRSLGVASVLNGAINFAQHRLERDRRVLADQGQTAQMASRELREAVEGQGMRGVFFSQERRQAMQMAAQEQRGMRNIDLAKIGGGMAAGALGGAAAFGVGAIPGALAGGALAFGGMMAGSDRMYSRVFDQEQYRQLLTREGMQKYEQNRAMLELQNPNKTIAFEESQRRADRNVQLERTLGLGDRDLYGQTRQGPAMPDEIMDIMNQPQLKTRYEYRRVGRGAGNVAVGRGYDPTGTAPLRPGEGGLQGSPMPFMGGEEDFKFYEAGEGAANQTGYLDRMRKPFGTKFGFSDQDIQGSIQSLIGAGATTEGARGMAGQALQFQRNLRLKNAQEVMGRLSGAGMQTDQTDDATLRLMAEAVKLGVDDSTMPQEMKRMTAVTAQLATQGGGFSAEAVENFAAGLTGFSQSEIGGAQSAFEEMQQRAKTAGGFEGQMGMGFLMGEGAAGILGGEAAGKLKGDSKLMNALNQLSAEDIDRDPGLAKGLAQQLGVSEDKIKELVRSKDEFKQTRLSTQQEASQALGEKIKGMKPEDIEKFLESEEGSKLYSEAAVEDIAAFGTAESGKGFAERRAGIVGRAVRGAGGRAQEVSAIEERLRGKLTSDEISEMEQIRSAGAPVGDELKSQAVNKELDNLVTAAKTHTAAAEMYNQQFDRFVEFAKQSGDALEQMGTQLDKVIEMMTENGIPPSSEPN